MDDAFWHPDWELLYAYVCASIVLMDVCTYAHIYFG